MVGMEGRMGRREGSKVGGRKGRRPRRDFVPVVKIH